MDWLRRVRWGNVGKLALLLAAGLLIATSGRGSRPPEQTGVRAKPPGRPPPDLAAPAHRESQREPKREPERRREAERSAPKRSEESAAAPGGTAAGAREAEPEGAAQPAPAPAQPAPAPAPPAEIVQPPPSPRAPAAPRSGEFTPDPAP
jgi:hypothetical protein